MKKTFISMMIVATLATACTPKETTLTFLESTDTHGNFADFGNDAALIKQMKNELGENLILLDAGDNMQGTTYQYCANQNAGNRNLTSAFSIYTTRLYPHTFT